MSKVERIGDRWFFWCPGCQENHAPNDSWVFNGDLDKPTFSPSILVNGRQDMFNPNVPRCHSFVIDGKIQFLDDCSHNLAGQTIELEEYK